VFLRSQSCPGNERLDPVHLEKQPPTRLEELQRRMIRMKNHLRRKETNFSFGACLLRKVTATGLSSSKAQRRMVSKQLTLITSTRLSCQPGSERANILLHNGGRFAESVSNTSSIELDELAATAFPDMLDYIYAPESYIAKNQHRNSYGVVPSCQTL